MVKVPGKLHQLVPAATSNFLILFGICRRHNRAPSLPAASAHECSARMQAVQGMQGWGEKQSFFLFFNNPRTSPDLALLTLHSRVALVTAGYKPWQPRGKPAPAQGRNHEQHHPRFEPHSLRHQIPGPERWSLDRHRGLLSICCRPAIIEIIRPEKFLKPVTGVRNRSRTVARASEGRSHEKRARREIQ